MSASGNVTIQDMEREIWIMLDSYEFLSQIDSEKLCDNFEFWTNVKTLCQKEFDLAKRSLLYQLDEFLPTRKGLVGKLFCGIGSKYEWPGIHRIYMVGIDNNTQEYHCVVSLFNRMERYSKDKFEYIYVDYNEYSSSFQIHLLG